MGRPRPGHYDNSGGIFLRKLNAALERFARTHPRFGIPDLMRYIIIGNVLVFFLLRLSSSAAVLFLGLDWGAVFRGEIWRLLTFVFVPNTTDPFSLILSLYFMYFIGGTLEREWRTPKFSLFYFAGVALTVLTALICHLAGASGLVLGTYYVGMSMFLAFAALYPDAQLMLFFVIPLKAKWLAAADLALFLADGIGALFQHNYLGALLPAAALLNVLLFFWCDLADRLGESRRMAQHRRSPQTIQFKSAVRRQRKREEERGYRHKCSVCGRTDTEWPEFRYCSLCAGYHCFCQDHIFSHEHYRE